MSWLRWIALPLASLLLAGAVIGVQLGNGGGHFEPLKAADPCQERAVTSLSDGIEGLTERLVLLGVDGAACRLGVTREALTLELAQSDAPSDAQIASLRAGLLDAVDEMKRDGTLPPASDLVDEALESTDLNGLLERAIRALPNSLINSALKTDDVLTRAVEDLDLRNVLANLNDQSDLNNQVERAVTQAVKDSLEARLRNIL